MSTPSGGPDRVRIHPSSLSGTVQVPGDKSLSHRCLLIGALVDGEVALSGLAPSGDVAASAGALRMLGVEVELGTVSDGSLVGVVRGPLAPPDAAAPLRIDCGNSGTTLRLLAGLVAGAGGRVELDGDASLRRRPVDRIIAPLRAMGTVLEAREDRLPPLRVLGRADRATSWTSSVASAQVKSAVLLAGLGVDGETLVHSPAASRDHTERMLRAGGVDVRTVMHADGSESVRMRPSRPVLHALHASRDPSAAAFWQVAAACGAGTIRTPGLCLNPGRTGALDVLRAFGADVVITGSADIAGEPVGDVEVAPGALGGAAVSGALVVRSLDELPVLALAGAMSAEGLDVRDAAELRVKESDRISTVGELFIGLGMRIEERADGFRVPGGQRPMAGVVHAHGDHRIAMTAAIAAVIGTGPVEVSGFGAVATSYPAFLSDLEQLGGRVEVLDA
jgi:3-phosphoshikimate 1-carboxyvinyltransferase